MYHSIDRPEHKRRVEVRESVNWKIVERIRELLQRNGGYCPLKKEHLEENRCMCQEFRDQKSGWCRCGLYEKITILEE